MQSGLCTPATNYMGHNGFKYTSMNDILTAKLKNLNSVSPHSRTSSDSIGGTSHKTISNKNLQQVALSPTYNMMKMIRGGNGKDNKNHKYFFNKVINENDEKKRISYDKIKKMKNDEMKILDNDNFNNSKDYFEEQGTVNKRDKKENGGLFNFFSKLISK